MMYLFCTKGQRVNDSNSRALKTGTRKFLPRAPVAAVCRSIPTAVLDPRARCAVMVPPYARAWAPPPTSWVPPPSTTCCAARSRNAAHTVAALAVGVHDIAFIGREQGWSRYCPNHCTKRLWPPVVAACGRCATCSFRAYFLLVNLKSR